MCDGSEPIVAVIEEKRKEEPVAKLECPKCGKKYQRGGSRYDKHVEECGEDESDGGAERESQKTASSGGGDRGSVLQLIKAEGETSIKDHTLAMLETIEEHYEGKLKQVKILISAVRNASEPEV